MAQRLIYLDESSGVIKDISTVNGLPVQSLTFDPVTGTDQVSIENQVNTLSLPITQESKTNEASGTTINRYEDCRLYKTLLLDYKKTGGSDTCTLRIFLSSHDDGTVLTSANYTDVTLSAVPVGAGSAAATHTASIMLRLDVSGANFINIQTITSGGANNSTYTIRARGQY
jgi:hypothetical protein